MFDVACVGILVADVLVKPVDSLPQKGLLGQVDSIEMFTGGNAMTASINLSKMGFKSAVIGKIGNDIFGEFLTKKLAENGVDTQSLAVDNAVQTSTSVALSSADGERTFLHCVGSNGTFSIDDVKWDVVADSKYIFVTGSFLLNDFDGEPTVRFLKKCKEMGKKTFLDVCWDSKNRWSAVLDQCLPYIDVFLPSIEEAQMLAKSENIEEIATTFFDKGVGSLVIKMGSNGCYVKEKKSVDATVLPICKNVVAVDTTGAGDSFCSGFIAAQIKGLDFITSAKFANATGAHCVMKKGATTGIKSYDEIYKFMEEN